MEEFIRVYKSSWKKTLHFNRSKKESRLLNQNLYESVLECCLGITNCSFIKDLLNGIMDEELKRELSLERLLNLKKIDFLPQKFDFDLMKYFVSNILEQLNPAIKTSTYESIKHYLLELWQPCGSIVEGPVFARNFNPRFPRSYLEAEVDFMVSLGKILQDKSMEVIVDLTYAKGFAWIKYEPGSFRLDLSRNPGKYLVKHEDGNTYFSSKAVKSNICWGSYSFPELYTSIKNNIKGPSVNTEFTVSHLSVPSKASINDAIKALRECALFIQDAIEDLKKVHCNVLSKLKELENVTNGSYELISIGDIEELAFLVLPSNKERNNILLEVHWMLLAFINETLSTTLAIERMLWKTDILENLGILKIFYQALSSNPKSLYDDLDGYFKYLLDSLPGEVLEKYKLEAPDGLSYFFQKCFHFQQDKVEGLFHVLENCKRELVGKCKLLEIFLVFNEDQLQMIRTIKECVLHVSIDAVPAIAIEDWPYIASEWITRGRLWPTLSLVKETVMRGCHIVPKPFYGHQRNELLDWRWSFSVAEMILANARTKQMSLSYLVLKLAFYRYLKPAEHNHETLPSYLIKTVMLWQCEENDETWWSERTIVSCVSVLLERLKESFYNKHLPHYFIRDINLFDNIDDELILYGQAILLSICADPIVCIEEVAEKLVRECSEMDSKTIAKTNTKYKVNMPLMIAKFQEIIKEQKEQYKDTNLPPVLGTALNISQTFSEVVMPQLFPGVTEVQEESVSQDNEINFDDIKGKIICEIADILGIPLDQ